MKAECYKTFMAIDHRTTILENGNQKKWQNKCWNFGNLLKLNIWLYTQDGNNSKQVDINFGAVQQCDRNFKSKTNKSQTKKNKPVYLAKYQDIPVLVYFS